MSITIEVNDAEAFLAGTEFLAGRQWFPFLYYKRCWLSEEKLIAL